MNLTHLTGAHKSKMKTAEAVQFNGRPRFRYALLITYAIPMS